MRAPPPRTIPDLQATDRRRLGDQRQRAALRLADRQRSGHGVPLNLAHPIARSCHERTGKNAADPYRQPLPRTPARRIADDAEAIRVARELAGLFAEEASLRDRQRRPPVAELEAFSQSGLWGISVPRAYGGAEVGYRTLAEVLKTIAAVDPSLAQLPQNHLAVLDHLRLDGSEEQKRFFYGLVLDGVRFGNAFSERHSRTVAEFQTRVLADGDGFRIDGRKFYSSGALLAHWVPAVGLDAEQRAHLAFIPRDAPGLTVIDDWSGFGQRTTASGTVILDNVRVPAEHVIPVHRAFDRPTRRRRQYRSSSRPPSTPASPVASSPRPCSRCAATRGHG